MAKNNGLSTEEIIKVKEELTKNLKVKTQTNIFKTWTTFTYYGEFMWRIRNTFRNSTIKSSYKITNKIFKLLSNVKRKNGKISGIYKLTYNTCNSLYIDRPEGRSA